MLVQKYGGSSLASIEKIKEIAHRVQKLREAGQDLILVVSAMGPTTDELFNVAHKISSEPNQRELDMLLSAGERISMSLMSMALNEIGCPAISLTGSQAGILTNSKHNSADIEDVKPFRVAESLEKGLVVVLAGFQGVDPIKKEVTTLGRGGSDTTAVAMAAHFGGKCQMFKDVEGVFTADPKVDATAKLITEMSYEDMEQLCRAGSQVLHLPCVLLAKENNVAIEVGSAHTGKIGTCIGPQPRSS